ncbi:nucleotide sugar transporter SLC35B4-like [Paramacrobiotus metropolitanus]|uniref:nucleotide sugar transporter SLC35B4-like n=1 Tax=Paramacrobiotus metropolitanus TaxID=2943436 RepID=UPI00244594E1|nr:nucleotide sugar transporter SLC35B4-like [Paramacrobiotus metropolitanus]
MSAAFLVSGVLFCCSVNVMILELQIKADPGSANLITFCQFLFVAVVGFMTGTNFGRKTRVIPLRHYAVLTTLYFVQSFANNKALSYNISMPMHMIIKSGSLVANMILGVSLAGKRYPASKWVSIFLVSGGIILCTLASADDALKKHENREMDVDEISSTAVEKDSRSERGGFVSLCIGVGLVSFSVFVAAGLGLFQEILFKRYGRHSQEGVFYTHILPLPCFIFAAESLIQHVHVYNASEPYFSDVLMRQIPVPRLWLLMLANVITFFGCSSSVVSLMTICSSLTVTLVLTLRKFFSIFISVYWFDNTFHTRHWVGTFFVFLGTLLYIDLSFVKQWWPKPKQS